jgi:glyoxylase-like metal-dependent hydrolase (beta-lactamase superfamily II)
MVIDTGHYHKQMKLFKFMMKNNINPSEIRIIILTHAHYDHVGNVAWLKKITKAKVFIHKNEADFLSNSYSGIQKGTGIFANFIVILGKIFPKSISFEGVEPDEIIRNDMSLRTYGFPAQIIYTPGHSSGSVSIVFDNGIAFVGDLCSNFKLQKTIFPHFIENKYLLLDSWEKLNISHANRFYPGHGKDFGVDKLYKSINALRREIKG